MRRTKMAVLGMMMVLSMTACAGKAETKSIGAEITVQETTEEEMTTETVKADRGESEESMIGMPNPCRTGTCASTASGSGAAV